MTNPETLVTNLSINPRQTQCTQLNAEKKCLFDMLTLKCPIWPGEFIRVGRIPLSPDFGVDLNVKPIVDLMARLVGFLTQLQIRYSKVVLRDYITMRVQALVRGGYANQAYLLMFASFIYDSRLVLFSKTINLYSTFSSLNC